MKKSIYILLISVIIVFESVNVYSQPININNNPVVSTCNIGNYGQVMIQVPTEVLTGDNIPLNITLPPVPNNCTKNVIITSSTNMNFGSSPSNFPFLQNAPNEYINAGVIEPSNGQNFNVMFKFPGGVTCNGSSGEFKVKVEINCNGTITSCEAIVKITARAANYWTITKEYVGGNLTCGTSVWRIRVTHSNPNGLGLGAYNLSGTITEQASVPIISGSNFNLSNLSYLSSYPYNYTVTLQNCVPQGSTISNTANYNFSLGNNCETMNGSRSATSPPMQSPNASIQFMKQSWANGGIYVNGCQGRYLIRIYNNGNVDMTNFTITDNLSIPGINITSISLNGWTQTPSGATSGNVTWTRPGFVLSPNQISDIYIYFTITGSVGSSVSNTAYLSYSGGGGVGGNSNPSTICPGINCPSINTAIQNTSVSTSFTIQQPQAIPSIVKCNTPNPWVTPIVQVGQTIKFKIQVGNSGSAPLTTIVTDAMDAIANQNLTIVSGSVGAAYFSDQNYNSCGSISGSGVAFPGTIPGATFSLTGTPQNPAFNIGGLPGNCQLYRTNILAIEFDAVVNPQLYGSKTNIAKLGTLSGSANYTVDRTGELKISKTADAQNVDINGAFNYFITVSNVGSDPLNNIKVTDILPSCVILNGPITVQKGTAIISFTSSANVIITVNPTAALQPGESFVIKIPVKRLGGGSNCCNAQATAEARMQFGNQILNAITPADQIVCVTTPICCDIPNIVINVIPNGNTQGILNDFRLIINSNSTPIQEIEVSMVDYHVTYINQNCKPLNMGNFGNISSMNVGSLILNNNNSHSIQWLPGSPMVLSGMNFINLVIKPPSILDLCCCQGTMYFSLKVRIKDISCRVCEKIIYRSFSLNKNYIGCEPVDINPYPNVQIRPELKDRYEEYLEEQIIIQENENSRIHQGIEEKLKLMDPKEADVFINQFNKSKTPSVNNYGINDEGIK
jgi:uncharacterized repeat protein (TIGR01451 family)